MRIILALLAVLLIPAIAFGMVSFSYFDSGISNPFEIGLYMTQCFLNGGQNSPDIAVTCEGGYIQDAIGFAALVAAALGLVMMLVVAVAGMVAGSNRKLLPAVFKTSTFIAILMMAVVVLIQATLIFFLIMGAMFAVGLVFPVILIGAGFGVMVLVLSVLSGLFGMFKKALHNEQAVLLTPEKAKPLHDLVDDIVAGTDLRKPDNIIGGLQPNFYAVSTEVQLSGFSDPVHGETLYVSLPLLRVMSVEEIRSIIGHELGHFSGQDTRYSVQFLPAYAGLGEVQMNLRQNENLFVAIGSIPVHVMINYIFSLFEPIVAKISREREFRADKIGASVGSPEALSSSLVKLTALGEIWHAELVDLVDRLQRHRGARNLGLNFVERSRFDTDHDQMHELTRMSLDAHIPHPVDTHPTTKARLEALGVKPDPILDADVFKSSLLPADTLAKDWPELEALEEELTTRYQDYLRVFVGRFDTAEDRLIAKRLSVASQWLARMALADGKTDPQEIRVGQKTAIDAGLQFDPSLFRELCREGTQFPDLEEMIEESNGLFSVEQAGQLKTVLRAVAEADEMLHPEELKILHAVDARLTGGLKLSPQAIEKVTGLPTRSRRRRR